MSTDEQIQESMTRLINAFPSLGEWYGKYKERIREIWFDILRPTDADDLATVVDQLIYGQVELPRNFEFDRLAIRIRQVCNDRKRERDGHTEDYQQGLISKWRREASKTKSSQAHLSRLIKDAQLVGLEYRSGAINEDEHRERIDQIAWQARNLQSDQDDPRYKCGFCRDTGKIEVYHPDFIAAARASDRVTNAMKHTCMTACPECELGNRLSQGNNKWQGLPEYHPMQHHRVHQNTLGEFERVCLGFNVVTEEPNGGAGFNGEEES